MGQYSIKEVEILSGVKAHTLRIWEQRYGLLKPERTGTNIRYYSDDQLRELLNIATLNRNGMKISHIARMEKAELNSEVVHVFEASTHQDNLLDSLIYAMVDFDENRFEKTLSAAIVKQGFEHAIVNLIFPFLKRTGVLWVTGSVRVSQEHFISNLIRRKICAAIDGIYIERNEKSRKFLLFLPEGETHELMLLFTEYLLRKNNHEVVYLGASLPWEDLEFANETFKPQYLVTYQTVQSEHIAFEDYIKKMSESFPHSTILVNKTHLVHDGVSLPQNCIAVESAEELLHSIH